MGEHEGFLRKLTEALNEPEIQAKIRAIAAGEAPAEPSDVLEEVRLLRDALAECERERDGLRADLKQAGEKQKRLEEQKNFLGRMADQVRDENAGLKQELAGCRAVCEVFRTLLVPYRSYRALPDGLREGLEKILPSEDPIRFLTAGSQIDRLLRFWDEVRSRAETLTEEQRRTLTEVIAFFVGQFNALWERPVYEMMPQECGKPFDDRRHIRSAGCSRYQGDVQQVLLEGIWNLNQNRAERRCVVLY